MKDVGHKNSIKQLRAGTYSKTSGPKYIKHQNKMMESLFHVEQYSLHSWILYLMIISFINSNMTTSHLKL
jgi:hypothetical protein